jgi:hypothetical protein
MARLAFLMTIPNSFIIETEDSVVRSAQTNDIMNNLANLYFTICSAWLDIQSDCPDFRRTHDHLKQGTCPLKTISNIKDDYLLVVLVLVLQKYPNTLNEQTTCPPPEHL